MGRPGMTAAHDPVNLVQFVHKIGLGMQAAGGVADDHVHFPRAGGIQGVEEDGGGVRPGLLLDDLRPHPVRPDLQLLDGRRPEGIPGYQEHLLPRDR